MTAIVEVPSAEDLCELVSAVWTSFLGDELFAAIDGVGADHSHDVVASVSISGAWHGHLLIATSVTTAEAVARLMFGMEDEPVGTEETADAVGELANIIGGNVKSMLPEPSSLSLPQVVIGATLLSLPSAHIRSEAVLQWNDEVIVVSLWEAAGKGDH